MLGELQNQFVPVSRDGVQRCYSAWPIKSDFLIACFPVTAAEFQEIAASDPDEPASRAHFKLATWAEAIHYCNLLNEKHGLPRAYDEGTGLPIGEDGNPVEDVLEVQGWRFPTLKVKGFRMPTLAEWEWAAMGRSQWKRGWYLDLLNKTHYIHGLNYPGQKEPDPNDTELGKLEENALGLYGMLGNAVEWCCDNRSYEYRRNLTCLWQYYFANYDNAISYMVTSETGGDAVRHRFRIVRTCDEGG